MPNRESASERRGQDTRSLYGGAVADAGFEYTELLPLGPDDTPYRLVTTEGVSTFDTPAGSFLRVEPRRSRG